MFAHDGTGNFKHERCNGSGYRCGLRTTSVREKHQNGQLTIGKASTTSAVLGMRAVGNETLGPSARPRRTTTP